MGVMVWKYPQDMWIFQEIIFETRPDVIIECGTGLGGSALFLASICDLVGNGQILTIDRRSVEGRPVHDRITYLSGSTTASVIVDEVRGLVEDKETVMVVLDSDHHKAHVLHEMLIYGQLVTSGAYMIVEDTAINGHPSLSSWGLGPWEAVEDFLSQEKTFVIDRSREKFLMSANPNGYLRKI
jgi:cephalosporin hydroxylase